MIRRAYTVLDVFCAKPLEGNPVAIFSDSLDLAPDLMQRVARELNLSETVFLGPVTGSPAAGDPHAELRIFTPLAELPFAGHPVLGTAFFLRESLGLGDVTLRLRVPAGVIPISFAAEEGEMEQPLPQPIEFPHEEEILAALGVERAVLGPQAYCNGPIHVFVELPSLAEVSALRPDLRRLGALGEVGFSAYAPAGEPGRYRTRMFGPGLGVSEDPATGSAAGPLAAHLVRHGRVPPGTRVHIDQGVEMGRPSVLLARAEGDAQGISQVLVAGRAVTVARGEYRLA